MNPKVSIIVPIYNSEKYMSKCIESILNQTLSEIEIILVNDGSTDNSRKIIENYAKKDNRIKVIHQQNSGPSVARNKGIRIAKGKYIGFVDSDDYIEPNMYEELYNNANNKNIEVAMCSYNEKHLYNDIEYVIKPKLDSNRIYEKEDIKQGIISTFSKNDNYGFYSLCNKLYLKEWLIKENLTIDTNRDHGEDWWFNINVFSKLNSFVYIDKVLYNYVHSNNNSLMVKYRENQFDLFLDGRLKMKEIMPKEYMDYNELNKRFVYEFSAYIIRTFKEVKDSKKRNLLIRNVLNNEEVKESCKNLSGLPIHFKVVSFLIKNNFKSLAFIAYKGISILT
jgi:glycosyltransferase involved in cell wall biosynthesis|nr:glycosyltransferase [uncultured Romboutsia sp.]